MILVPKFMVRIALSDKIYLSLGLLSPLRVKNTTSSAIKGIGANVLTSQIISPYKWLLGVAKT